MGGAAVWWNRLAGVVGVAGALSCHRPAPEPPPPPPVQVVTLGPREIEQTFEWLATLDGSTNADIRPRVEGHIESVDYQEGSVVEKGAPLFTIDKRPLYAEVEKAKGGYEQALAQRNKARADVARYTPLVAERAISKEELDNARAAEQVGVAIVQAAAGELASARLNLGWADVRSPIRGIAGIAQTRVGNLVNPNQVLTVVSTVDPIRASFYISEREYLSHAEVLNHINAPQYENHRYLELILLDGQVHPYRSRQIIVSRMIDPTTGTLLIQALFPNPGNILRPGLFAKVEVYTGRHENVVLVPELGVQQVQGLYQVAVVEADGRVAVRKVTLGQLVGHSYVVRSGLQKGERVIVEGQQSVRPGMVVQILPPDGGS